MTYATMLVHFDGGGISEQRLRLAAGLAQDFRADLIGIAGRSYLPTFLADGGTDTSEDSERKETAELLARIGTRFEAVARNIRRREWRGRVGYINELIVAEARAADLVIVGRERDPGDLYFALDPAAVILRAGRPVLLVPAGVDKLETRRVLVAWKDTRATRRAVRDALPFLRTASHVMIVEVCEPGSEMRSQHQIEDVSRYLQRHKVEVAVKAFLQTAASPAQELLRFAEDEKADLIVAGGYGHSRLGEWMLGGVTRSLLHDSPRCCLFSH
ncbi:MAG: universal stress protein [Hyphomicrobiales bacterium]|nr:universal stress protein [Hyphomicrobiales bacterium]